MGRAGDKRRAGTPDPRQATFGQAMKQLRVQRGWTQEQLAMLLHYEDQAMISLIESGERAPSVFQAVDIAQLFQTTVNDMCGYRIVDRSTYTQCWWAVSSVVTYCWH